MKEYIITPTTSSSEISQWMSDVEKEIDSDQQALNIIENKLSEIDIAMTKLLLEKKELAPNKIKANFVLKNKRQVYKMLERNYFIQGKKGL